MFLYAVDQDMGKVQRQLNNPFKSYNADGRSTRSVPTMPWVSTLQDFGGKMLALGRPTPPILFIEIVNPLNFPRHCDIYEALR